MQHIRNRNCGFCGKEKKKQFLERRVSAQAQQAGGLDNSYGLIPFLARIASARFSAAALILPGAGSESLSTVEAET
jgi:hypothetical protein